MTNFGETAQNEFKIVQEGGIKPLVNLLRSPNYKVVEQAAVTLRNLSVNGKYQSLDMLVNSLPLNSILARSLRNELYSIFADANKVYFGTDGALPPLVALLRSPQLAVQEQAAVILRNLSLTAENERNIIQEGGLPAVIALLRTNEPRLQVGGRHRPLTKRANDVIRNAEVHQCGTRFRAYGGRRLRRETKEARPPPLHQ